MLFFRDFLFFRAHEANPGPETKKRQLICHQDLKIYASLKFEGRTLKNEKCITYQFTIVLPSSHFGPMMATVSIDLVFSEVG